MTMLIEDLQDEIKNEGKAEEETQIEYESEMDKAKKLKGELGDKVVSEPHEVPIGAKLAPNWCRRQFGASWIRIAKVVSTGRY